MTNQALPVDLDHYPQATRDLARRVLALMDEALDANNKRLHGQLRHVLH